MSHTNHKKGRKAADAVLRFTRDDIEKNVLSLCKELSWYGIEAWSAMDKLADMGISALPTLRQVLLDANQEPEIRVRVARTMQMIGAPGEAMPALREALADRNRSVRDAAASNLKEWGVVAVPILQEALNESNPDVRHIAAVTLSHIVPVDGQLLLVLEEALRSYDYGFLASRALAEAGEVSLLVLQRAFQKRETCDLAMDALETIGPAALPILSNGLTDKRVRFRILCAISVGRMGSIGAAAGPILGKALMDEDNTVRIFGEHRSMTLQFELVDALVKIGRPALPELRAASRAFNPKIRMLSVRGLGTLAKNEPAAASAVVSDLCEALADRIQDVRQEADEALRKIGSPAAQRLNDAKREVNDEEVRRAIVRILADLAPDILAIDDAKKEPIGIERMGAEELFEVIEPLRVFRQIGAMCRSRKHVKFVFKRIASEISCGEATVRRAMDAISLFFRKYYKRYEQLDIPADDDQTGDPLKKFIHRAQGKAPTIMPVGWRAWEETCRYLDSIEPQPFIDK